MSSKVKVAIIGSTGYGGVELIRLLASHPQAEVTSVISSSSAGAPIAEGFPHLTEIRTDLLDDVNPELIKSKADVVFIATPAGIAAKLVPSLLEVGLKVIDISGDYRLKSREQYEMWYKKEAADQIYIDQAVYGLSEIYGDAVRGVDFVSNPGCFPTATLLGLVPAVKAGFIDPSTIIIDAKTGVSGAGRGVNLGTHFSELNENFKAYKLNKHQHIPEIEQVLSDAAGKPVITTFTTHLVPMTRGIMSTIYASVNGTLTDEDFVSLYRNYYEGRPFVRVRNTGTWPTTKEVWGSNYCDIGFSVDERTGRVTIISVIDNLVKGAAGQAIQNLNLMLGWDETLGLKFVPTYP
ncbi:N-acetyl-gamma-glutamyl-phosphate reductase [Paenibacillus baekrokdamisoli]|uniref:N-acetyl-gamma-glutamyl-phosphate reductase n=1 Tax=Paenibacillus baekrokdamisoli TaxID=1712516 RepID=A0A3G9IYH4_9BACL|nr:N-acetyl-gamma-glutamyl-phosphate reductase [Paenibacillus baekrokdamisoli]MBB3073305.1 N-acetyl-gamma-glutamyl-phosphate reductase [Paenibacillus baekrokdamisoli]BBH23930.1 N-acetyl-gamma-glutamyl-phosphate reductase [Paenibacillus baekrokdamisoli]